MLRQAVQVLADLIDSVDGSPADKAAAVVAVVSSAAYVSGLLDGLPGADDANVRHVMRLSNARHVT